MGYLAEDIAPCDLHGVEKSAFVHVEVLSTDSRMIDFLSNKAQVKSGPKYVHIHPESSVYARSGDTFTQTKGKVKKDIHKIMRRTNASHTQAKTVSAGLISETGPGSVVLMWTRISASTTWKNWVLKHLKSNPHPT